MQLPWEKRVQYCLFLLQVHVLPANIYHYFNPHMQKRLVLRSRTRRYL